MALSQNIQEIHMTVLEITQSELVPAPEFPSPLATYQHYRDKVRARGVAFSQNFFYNLLIYSGAAVYHRHDISHIHIYTLKLETICWHCKKVPIIF